MTSSEVDRLYMKVSEAIRRAEGLDNSGNESHSAWVDVSNLEDKISMTEVSKAEKAIARRGAISAALKANDYDMAKNLAEKYFTEPGIPDSHFKEIRSMLDSYSRG